MHTLRTRARLETDLETKRSLLREAKALAEGPVGDRELAEAMLRDLLNEDEGDLWALEELTKLRAAAGDDAEVVTLLLKRAELVEDGAQALSLRHQAARVLVDKLKNTSRAMALYEEILDAEPTDAEAATAVRALYAEAGKHKELAKLLTRLIDVASSAEERSRLRVELALIQSERFKAPEDAVETLRAILDEEPGHAEAVLTLSQLYEQTGRDSELADLLKAQLDAARGQGDPNRGADAARAPRRGRGGAARRRRRGARDVRAGARARRKPQGCPRGGRAHRGEARRMGARVVGAHEARRPGERRRRGALGPEACPGPREAGRRRRCRGGAAARPAARPGEHRPPGHPAVSLGEGREVAGAGDAARGRCRSRGGGEPHRQGRRSRSDPVAGAGPSVALAGEDDVRGGAASQPEIPPPVAEQLKLLKAAADIHVSKRKSPADAIPILERAAALVPHDRDLLLALGDAYTSADRGRDAAQVLERVIASFGGKRTKEVAGYHLRLARALNQLGEKEQALAQLDMGFKVDPGSVAILKDLGILAFETNDLDRAQKTFRALLLQRLDPAAGISKGEVFYYLGEISAKQGDKAKAVQMFERAIENDASLTKAKAKLAELKG